MWIKCEWCDNRQQASRCKAGLKMREGSHDCGAYERAPEREDITPLQLAKRLYSGNRHSG